MTLNIDIETFSSVDLTKQGVYRYVESEDFTILLFGYRINNEEVKVIDLTKQDLPDSLILKLYDVNVVKTAFNANFEFTCINTYLTKHGHPVMDFTQWDDTQFLAHYAGYQGGLDMVAKQLDLDVRKDAAGTRLINKFSKPCRPSKKNPKTRNFPEDDPEGWNEFIEYNRRDVQVESKIREILAPIKIPEKEIEAFRLDQKINSSGIYIDTDLVTSAMKQDAKEKQRLTEEIARISNIRITNPKSTKQVTDFLSYRAGKSITKINKEVVNDLIADMENQGLSDCVKILKLRNELSKTSIAKYRKIDNMICKDNRVRGILQFYGTHTGRWAGRGVQAQNLPRNYFSDLALVRESFKYGILDLYSDNNPSDTASQLIRTVFIPSPGKHFAVADYSAIEARVIAWLANETWRLDTFRNNGDIYCASASKMFNVPVETILDKNHPNHLLRAQGKVAELALGYQGATGAIARMDFNNSIPENKRQDIVNKWRNESKNIVKFWHLCEDACSKAVSCGGKRQIGKTGITAQSSNFNGYTTLCINLPSGRVLYYPKAKRIDQGFSYQGLDRTTHQISEIEMYGGKIVENIVSGIARDCLSEALLRLDKAGYDIKFHVHDEVVVEVDSIEGEPDRVIKIMTQNPDWAKGLPLNAAGFTSDFYMKD